MIGFDPGFRFHSPTVKLASKPRREPDVVSTLPSQPPYRLSFVSLNTMSAAVTSRWIRNSVIQSWEPTARIAPT